MNNEGGGYSAHGKYHDPSNPIAFMDVSRDGEQLGQMKFELFNSRVPKTVENFRQIITGENDLGYKYEKSTFFRIIGGFMA